MNIVQVPADEGDNIDEDDSFEEGELPEEEKEEEEAGREEGLPEYDEETQALVDGGAFLFHLIFFI